MAKEKKQEEPQRKKNHETKIYYDEETRKWVDKRVREGKFKNRQQYHHELIRRDRLKQGMD